MKIPRMNAVTLGVSDLAKATAFYREVLETPPNTQHEGVAFIELPGVWLSLFPLDHLAKDIGPDVPAQRHAFSGFTIGHNTRRKDDVDAILARAKTAGARILKPAQDTFWGGYAGYFADPDGYVWEVAWGEMFDFKPDGTLQFKPGNAG